MRSHLMDGLPLLLSCMGDTAQERVAKMGGWRRLLTF